jgi:hypothetical protein
MGGQIAVDCMVENGIARSYGDPLIENARLMLRDWLDLGGFRTAE